MRTAYVGMESNESSGAGSEGSLTADEALSQSGSGSGASALNVIKSVSINRYDTCGFTYTSSRRCMQPRGCEACLNVLLTRQCAISPSGACVETSEYDYTQDFRRQLPGNAYSGSKNYFPSSNTTYCAASDRVCIACRRAWAAPVLNPNLAALQFCRGDGGCVCVRACEVGHLATTQNGDCYSYDDISSPQTTSNLFLSVVSFAAVVAICAIVTLAYQLVRSRRRRPQSEPIMMDIVPRERPPSLTPQLQLTGWKLMQRDLIQAEARQLAISQREEHTQGEDVEVHTSEARRIRTPRGRRHADGPEDATY